MEFLRSLIGLPRRNLLGMKEKDLQPLEFTAQVAQIELANSLTSPDSQPDAATYENSGVAIVFSLMIRALRRKRAESQVNREDGRPKSADRRHGQNMSRARGANN